MTTLDERECWETILLKDLFLSREGEILDTTVGIFIKKRQFFTNAYFRPTSLSTDVRSVKPSVPSS